MELKSKLILGTLICIGLSVAGCSQQQTAAGSQQLTGSQQTAQQSQKAACPPCEQAKPTPPPVAPPPVQRPTPKPPVKRPPPPRPVAPPPVKVPQVKAKGKFKGPVKMDKSSKEVMQQYQR